MTSEVFNVDCLEYMQTVPDKFFDLAVVDPVYGDLVTKGGYMANTSSVMAKNKDYHISLWSQNKTGKKYFDELFRVSKNQIVFGGNYFVEEVNLNSSCWIVWNKENGQNDFADCELAWTSFKTAVRIFNFRWQGMLQGDMKNKEHRIHPTQKPVALYDWIFKNYAKAGDKIFDSHLGSQSSRISAHKAGLDFWGTELDPQYFQAGCERYEKFISQLNLF